MICPICKRKVPDEYQEKHHLVPKSKKGKETIIVCWACGDMIHQLFDNWQLTNVYNSLEMILMNEKIQDWIKWIHKKPIETQICMAKKKRS